MKRKVGILVGSLIFLLVFINNNLSGQADEIAESEMIVLIDISGTMDKYSDLVKACIEWIGSEMSNYNTKLTLKTFADPGEIGEICSARQIIWEDSETEGVYGNNEDIMTLSQYKEKAALKGIQFNKAWTDHRGAFLNAETEINVSNARFKCIVILSDAKLDYDKTKYKDKDTEKEEEKKAEDEFVESVNRFAKKSGQKVVLIYFGDEWDLFNRCKEANVFSGEKFLKSNEIIEEIMSGVGLKSESVEVDPDGSQARFTLDSDAYRVIFHLRGVADSYDKNIDMLMTREEDGRAVKAYDHSQWEGLNLFFYSDLPKGHYVVTLPKGQWEYEATVRRKILSFDIKISVEQNKADILQQNGVYNITSESFTLNVQVKADQNDGERDEMDYLEIGYSITPIGNRQENDSSDKDGLYGCFNKKYDGSNRNFSQEIDLGADNIALNGEYECRITIRQGDEVCCESEPILIKVDAASSNDMLETTPHPDETLEVNIVTGDKIDVRTVFQIPDDGMKYYIALNGAKKIYLGEDTVVTVDNLHYENGELSFKKVGHYTISVVSESGIDTGLKIDYNVTSKCWLLELWNAVFN